MGVRINGNGLHFGNQSDQLGKGNVIMPKAAVDGFGDSGADLVHFKVDHIRCRRLDDRKVKLCLTKDIYQGRNSASSGSSRIQGSQRQGQAAAINIVHREVQHASRVGTGRDYSLVDRVVAIEMNQLCEVGGILLKVVYGGIVPISGWIRYVIVNCLEFFHQLVERRLRTHKTIWGFQAKLSLFRTLSCRIGRVKRCIKRNLRVGCCC